MTQNYRVPMKCVKCPGYYFGWWPKDENKMCYQCRDAKEMCENEWARKTQEYLNDEGKDRL